MRNKRALSLLFIVLPLVAYLLALNTSCSTIECPVQNKVALNFAVRTYDSSGAEVTDTLNDTLYVWSERKNGTDTLILNRAVGVTSFSLPLSYSHPEDVLVFATIAYDGSDFTLDTVWIQKEDIPHFESVDCSAHFFHNLTSVRSTHFGIDTVFINNPSVTYDPSADNIHIHFKE
jgi:hypothetical protein